MRSAGIAGFLPAEAAGAAAGTAAGTAAAFAGAFSFPRTEKAEDRRGRDGQQDQDVKCVHGGPPSKKQSDQVRVSHPEEGLSYIHNVVTDEAHRGHGYGKALVSSVCADAHERGDRVMLYADTSYPPSNALYRAVGFVEAGRLIGFDFTEA